MIKLLRIQTVIVVITLFLALHNYAIADNRETIGRWIDDTPNIGSTIEIYKQKGKFYISYHFKDGSDLTEELEKKINKGKTIYRKRDRPTDYYVISKDKNLESWDNLGFIFHARPMQ